MKIRKGMTLIEVIISIMLLGMISISILPMSVYSVKFAKWNNIRLNALNLAYSQVEWLKTLNYEELGLDISGYSPKGIVNPTSYIGDSTPVIIEGVKYSINTSIYWQKSTSSMGEPVPQAMKKIDVTVEAKDLNSGGQKEYAVLGTLVSREGERDPSKPGYIIAKVYLRSGNNPVKNIRVGLGQSQNFSNYSNTDENGEALFGDLNDGKYKIQPINWRYDSLMVMPNGVETNNKGLRIWKTSKEVTVPKWDKNKKDEIKYPKESFLIDLPGYINILETNKYPNATISIRPTGESYIPAEGEDLNHMLLNTTVKDINNIKFWRLWNYEYTILYGDEIFYFVDKETNIIWNGKFDSSNLNKDSIVDLYLSFGIKESSLVKNKNNYKELQEIIIEFTSNINNYKDIEFELNNNFISKDLYSIIPLRGQNNNKFRIIFNLPMEISGEEIEFKISNYESIINNYGMTLSPEKSMISISNLNK